MLDPVNLTQELIKKPSVTPVDHGCQDLIATILEPLGFKIANMPFADVNNLWAVRGNIADALLFLGHTDVVPTGPANLWAVSPFAAEIKDGLLYGRGAADMKASIAAFTVAIERFLHKYPNNNAALAMLLTSDEEGVAQNGTLKVVEFLKSQNIKVKYCLVGEPTCEASLGDTIKNGRRGSLNITLTLTGEQGHVGYLPWQKNIFNALVQGLNELVAYNQTWNNSPANCHNDHSVLQITQIEGGIGATNVVPGGVSARFNVRYTKDFNVDAFLEHINQIFLRLDTKAEVNYKISAQPFLKESKMLTSALQQAIYDNMGLHAKVTQTGGTSDGRFMLDIVDEIVEFGPLNTTIHALDERIAVHDIYKLADIYFRLLEVLYV